MEQLRAVKLTKTFSFGILCPTRTQATRCVKTFAFDFRVRLGTWQGSAPTLQPSPKSPQTLANELFFKSKYTVQCNRSAGDAHPGRRVTEKANRTRATCKARSGVNHSAIYYDFNTSLNNKHILFKRYYLCFRYFSQVPFPTWRRHHVGRQLLLADLLPQPLHRRAPVHPQRVQGLYRKSDFVNQKGQLLTDCLSDVFLAV
jgi:hypothetical protein